MTSFGKITTVSLLLNIVLLPVVHVLPASQTRMCGSIHDMPDKGMCGNQLTEIIHDVCHQNARRSVPQNDVTRINQGLYNFAIFSA